MNEELSVTSRRVGLGIIDLSDTHAKEMQTWNDLLAQNPESETAKLSAGFISIPTVNAALEIVVDVQAAPNEASVLRTWAIETLTNSNREESFNSIQLTFTTDKQKVHAMIASGNKIDRDDMRQLLNDPATQLDRVVVCDESGGDGKGQTHGVRYDVTVKELSDDPEIVIKVNETLAIVLQKLKLASTKH